MKVKTFCDLGLGCPGGKAPFKGFQMRFQMGIQMSLQMAYNKITNA
jgi:hypothetical protein